MITRQDLTEKKPKLKKIVNKSPSKKKKCLFIYLFFIRLQCNWNDLLYLPVRNEIVWLCVFLIANELLTSIFFLTTHVLMFRSRRALHTKNFISVYYIPRKYSYRHKIYLKQVHFKKHFIIFYTLSISQQIDR